nr:MAG TPA: STRUCTURAL MAINTENANCE OF CHROMOSOMES PROTEIN [Caudoviricetes sp.]
MRIISLEFVNHVKLGTFKMKWDNSIISIVGANGSGKSFLLSSVHPYGSSDRYNKAYPVIPEKPGYKKIVYDVDGVLYETIHEYVPHKNTHKCKSYLNRIVNNNTEELNPTGNVEIYKDLVYKHLKFNSDIFDIGFISFKANGITGTPTNRRNVLESTVDMSLLNKMKYNVATLSSSQGALVTISKKKQQELLEYGTVESIKERIDKYRADKVIFEKKIQEIDTNINATRSSLEGLEQLDEAILPSISLLIETLSKTSLNDYNELLNAYNEARAKLDTISKRSDDLSRIKNEINDNMLMQKNKVELEEALKKKNEFSKSLFDKLNKYITNPDLFGVQDAEKVMSDFIKILGYVEKLSTPIRVADINELIKNKNTEIEEMQSLINKFERALDLSDGKSYTVPYADNCNTCELYRKFIKTGEFIKNNQRAYDSNKDIIKTIKYDTVLLDNIKAVGSSVWSNNMSIIFTPEVINRYGLKDINDFLSKNNSPDVLQSFINAIKDTYYDYLRSKEEASQLGFNISETVSRIRNIAFDLEEVEKELELLKTDLSKYKSIAESRVSDISIPDKYKYFRVHDLIKLSNDINTSRAKIKEHTVRYNELLSERKEIESKIEENTRERITLELKLSELESISKELNKFLEDKEIISRCREIIDKNIPIMLLENNLKFLQDMTNEILVENNIPIQIEIDINNNVIVIPCTIEESLVPDASMLSAGETCLVSLILNACILHLLGYNIMCLDEIDANLDVERRKQFNNIVVTIMAKLDIDQICCISHNISSTIDSATIIQIGESQYEVLSKDIIKI